MMNLAHGTTLPHGTTLRPGTDRPALAPPVRLFARFRLSINFPADPQPPGHAPIATHTKVDGPAQQVGYDCGSGPTESLCGTLTDRLKGSGMRWDKDNAESLMALASLHHSGLWHSYWKAQRAAA